MNTQVTLSQTPPVGNVQYDITGGTRAGTNLFHSFGDFGVPTNNIANFLNNTGLPTSNILSRVTGGNPSNIFGTIQSTGFGTANLLLMNPAGIVFGPNATLNVGGSANFTTADYLRLADGGKFPAIPGALDASISSAPVAAFGFLGANPEMISVQGSQLAVTPGQSISLAAGNITIQSGVLDDGVTSQPARLTAPGGQISLASVASPGEILVGNMDRAPNINGQTFGALGSVQISQQSVVDVSGNGGGTVVIRSGRFRLDDSTISANTSGSGPLTNGAESIGGGIDIVVTQGAVIQNGAIIETNVLGNATPGVTYGGIHLKADRIEVIGTQDLDTPPATSITSDIASGSTGGNSGHVLLEANSILMQDFGTFTTTIEAVTQGAGNAGSIGLRANGNIEIETGTVVAAAQLATGDTGDIDLTSAHGNILLTDFATVTSQTVQSPGTAGTITLSAPRGNIIAKTGTSVGTLIAPPLDQSGIRVAQAGGGGGIVINANNLRLNGGDIGIVNLSDLPSGNITLNISETLSLNRAGPSQFFDGPLLSSIHAASQGPAPSAGLTITAHDISVTDRSTLTTTSVSSGAAGPLNISAETVQLTNGGRINSGSRQGIDPMTGLPGGTTPSGSGGTVTIHGLSSPAQSLMIDGAGSGILTNTEGTGPGGNIAIDAQAVTIQNGGVVSASTSGTAPSATGGNIAISANQSVSLNNGGTITASSTGPANAGNISINAGAQFLSNNGSITTTANQASGGNIAIQATDSIRLVNSQLSTSVQGGPNTSGGNILLDPAVVTFQNSQVTAQAVQGAGGNINIIAGTFLSDPASIVSASSQFGLSGSVNIQSPVSNLSGSMAPLTQRPLQAQNLLTQRCAAQLNGQLSSLVVVGRNALPVEPGGWLMSPRALLAPEGPEPGAQPVAGSTRVRPAQSPISAEQSLQQMSSSPQRGISDRVTGCGS
jgi:filamentous hemagglutinin family protein